MEVIPAFVIAVMMICISPGQDMAFVVASAVDSGSRAGVMSALGLSIGMFVHTLLAAIGVAALLNAFPLAIDAVRLLGAGYLIYLAVVTLRAARAAGLTEDVGTHAQRFFARGAITNLANPKIILFFAAFMPQFVRPERGNVATQFLVLGIIFLIIGLAVDIVVGLSAGRLRMFLVKGGRAAMTLSVLSGLTFGTIAVLLVTEVVRGVL